MKKEFTGTLLKKLILQQDYRPIENENGDIYYNENLQVLYKSSMGGLIILELIDGDLLTTEEIKAHLENNKIKLEEIKGAANRYIVELFIFQNEPENEKVEVIKNIQVNGAIDRKYLKSMSINLQNKSFVKYYKTPFSTFGAGKLIKSVFESESYESTSKEEIAELLLQKNEEYKIEFKVKTPIITYSLIAINAIVWIVLNLYAMKSGQNINELLITYGAKENVLIMNGEYWRFISPIFLHANITHLLLNCYSLYAVGVIVEKIYGRTKFAVIYFIAGIFGSIASFMFSPNSGVGASGAIFGLLGAMLYIGVEKPALFKKHFGYNVIVTIFANLAYGFSRAGIDNFAHIGGLIGGFLSSGIVKVTNTSRWHYKRLAIIGVTIIIAAAGVFYGFNNNQNRVLSMVSTLEQLDNSQKWSEAENTAEEILSMNRNNTNINRSVLWTLTKAEAMSGKYNEAVEHGKQLIQIDPQSGHYLLGVVYFDMKQYDNSKAELTEAKRLKAPYTNIDDLLKQIDQVTKEK